MLRRCVFGLLLLLLAACGAAGDSPTASAPSATPELARAATAQPSPAPTAPPTAAAPPTATAPPSPTPSPAPLIDPQSLALRPDVAAAPPPDLPQYVMRLVVDPAAGTFTGSQLISYTNTTSALLPDLVLRSYVNFPPDVMGDGGDTFMHVTAATVGGQAITPQPEAQDTAFRLALPQPLPPGQAITLTTEFVGTLAPWDDGSWPFLSSYPFLGVWDSAANAWRTDVTRFPDHVYAEAAEYAVDVVLPADYEVFATGSAVLSASDGVTTTTHFVSGPVREWAASFGNFNAVQLRSDGITVTAYAERSADLDLTSVAQQADQALRVFNQRFGPYPYRELDLHVIDWHGGDAGIEYPGLTLILVDDAVNQRTPVVVAHEVAHQWWYGLVGNDIYREPWLDESFASYSSIIAIEASDPALAERIYAREIEQPYRSGVRNGDPPAGLAITDYTSFNAYYWAIYGKGAVFLKQLRAAIGDDAFWAGLQRYYADQRYHVAQRADFQRAMEQAANRSLDGLFNTWLGQ